MKTERERGLVWEKRSNTGTGDDGSGGVANKIPEQKRKIERPIGLPLVHFFGSIQEGQEKKEDVER